jgi:alpha-L-fucosidase
LTHYEPTVESLSQHTVPTWFRDAKLGIFVHWGLYSVPAWAQPRDLNEIVKDEGWEALFRNNTYAEWYLNSMQFEGSPTEQYHRETFGADTPYDKFSEQFNQEIQNWNPADWAKLFKNAGAQYVVLTSRHCESFALWDTEVAHPHKGLYKAERNLIGELTNAVRDANMRMGLYYCGGMDWTFEDDFVIRGIHDVLGKMPQSKVYNDYINAQWRELIDQYNPDIMWNDIGWPRDTDPKELMAYFYNNIPDGIINDRFAQSGSYQNNPNIGDGVISNPKPEHYDYRTPEYTSFNDIQTDVWETCRGIGHSFGYNRAEGEDHYLKPDKLIHLFVDIVSKNGNLLLNVGPAADGSLHPMQVDCLQKLGGWLQTNGEAIYGTRPWQRAEGKTTEGTDIRFTQKGGDLFAILLGTPTEHVTTIEDIETSPSSQIQLLGHDSPLTWTQSDSGLRIQLSQNLPPAPAHAFKITDIG